MTQRGLVKYREGPLEKYWRELGKIHAGESYWKNIVQSRSEEKNPAEGIGLSGLNTWLLATLSSCNLAGTLYWVATSSLTLVAKNPCRSCRKSLMDTDHGLKVVKHIQRSCLIRLRSSKHITRLESLEYRSDFTTDMYKWRLWTLACTPITNGNMTMHYNSRPIDKSSISAENRGKRAKDASIFQTFSFGEGACPQTLSG